MFAPFLGGPPALLPAEIWFEFTPLTIAAIVGAFLIPLLWVWLTVRYIPNDYVGIVEKLLSWRGRSWRSKGRRAP